MPNDPNRPAAPWTRRNFLKTLGQRAVAGAAISAAGNRLASAGEPSPQPGRVRMRVLGRTGLRVSEIGFGGHSWSYARVPDGGKLRVPTLDEAMRMISLGLDLGVNLFDSCTPKEEHGTPGEAIKRLKRRSAVIVSARLCHKMKGTPKDQQEIFRFVDERLKLWQTDYFDILMVTNTENDTPRSGYWEMSHSIEAIEKLKKEGKVRFAGFGCHFTPELYLEAFAKYGRAFEICSMPYNVRHRAAEQVIPEAKKAGLAIITIKPFARGALLEGRDLAGADAGLARDMVSFVLANPLVDACICGVHTIEHVRENFSASWMPLTPAARERLERSAARTPCREHGWLEKGWLC